MGLIGSGLPCFDDCLTFYRYFVMRTGCFSEVQVFATLFTEILDLPLVSETWED
jgi:hypothetical protein